MFEHNHSTKLHLQLPTHSGRKVFTPCFCYPFVLKLSTRFLAYDRVFVAPKRITSAYNSCLYSVWTPTVMPEDVPAECSSEEQIEEGDEPEF